MSPDPITPAHAWPNRRSHCGRDGSDEPRSTSTGVRRVSQTPRWLSQPLAPSARIFARKFASASTLAFPGVCPSFDILHHQAAGLALQLFSLGDRTGHHAGRHNRGRRASIWTRRGYDWSDRFAACADAIARLPAKSLIIDGEMVVPCPTGDRSIELAADA